jgi:hypothetical protein
MHGIGQIPGAEIDFHRRVQDVLDQRDTDPSAAILKVYKLTLLAFMNGGNGLAFNALQRADGLDGKLFSGEDGSFPTNYLRFLCNVWFQINRMAKKFPILPDFGPIMHARRLQAYELSAAKNQKSKDVLFKLDSVTFG